MKKLRFFSVFLAVVFISISIMATAQDGPVQKYSQVRIYAVNQSDFYKLNRVDLHLDHGIYKPGYYYETWLSQEEINLLNKSGVLYTVTIEDWADYYNSLPKMSYAEVQAAIQQSIREYNVSHSIYGTMGGHLKVAEIVNKLDSLRIEYPNFVSQKFSIGETYEGRQMWTVRITNGPNLPTGRPEVWFNGATHAREPLGVSNVLYFIYWMLENYNTDPIAKYILDNREIYWTPLINVDGYFYNETTNPTGGGMWRKNRKPYTGGTGVDLNRNFGTYNFWNSTNGGSSTSASSDTYRGPNPASEPETQNFYSFVNSRNFKVSLDYHTYGNYLIKPYAWCDPIPTPHDYVYNEYGNDIVKFNGFLFGTPYQTVAYYVRGGDLDWMYSADSTGHTRNVFAMTPEVGTTGFWPTQAEIIPLAQTCLEMNKYISLVAGSYAGLKTSTLNKSTYVAGETGNVKVVIRNKGQTTSQNIRVELTPASNYLTIPVQLYTLPSLSTFASDSTVFNFGISAACPNNTALAARLRIKQNDSLVMYDSKVDIFVGEGFMVLADSAENGTGNWPTMTNWAIVTNKYYSPIRSFKGSCLSSTVSQMVSGPINISSYPAVFLSFYHKYALETGYDFGYVDVSTNNGTTWSRIAKYNGLDSTTWKFQSFNISQYVSGASNILVRFRDSTDSSVNWDGWYVDNIKITAYQVSPITGAENNATVPYRYSLEQNYPNPFNPVTRINYSVAEKQLVKISVYDMLGREVSVLLNEIKSPGNYSLEFNASQMPTGAYFYRMQSGAFTDTKKMILVK